MSDHEGGNLQNEVTREEHQHNLRAKRVVLLSSSGTQEEGLATSAKQDTIISNLQTINSLTPSVYDTIELGYTGDNLTTVVFKLGGTTISTLTLAYTGSRLDSVTKS